MQWIKKHLDFSSNSRFNECFTPKIDVLSLEAQTPVALTSQIQKS